MKKIYKFDVNDNEYFIMDGENTIFSISKENLEFDGNKFYKAFFEKNDDKINVTLEKGYDEEKETEDKILKSVYLLLNDMIEEISEKINNLNKKSFMEES